MALGSLGANRGGSVGSGVSGGSGGR